MRNPIIFSKEAISLFSQIISKKKKKEKKRINDSNKISFPRGNSLFSVSFSIDPRASFRLS